jgi:SMODS domain-containing protein
MHLDGHFDVLLKDTVNLSQFRLDTLDSHVSAICTALEADPELGPYVRGKIPQGSWAHRTIINPVGGKEFDADFMLLLEENPGWSASPKTYIDRVYQALDRHRVYGGMPHSRKCRCVRLTYAGSCHVDIVPYLTLSDGRQVIVNRDSDEWEDTNPEGFTAWMREKDQTAGGNLRRVIRLMKYLRDHKNSFTGTRSVLLTTLLGEQVSGIKQLFDTGYYNSTPTSLVHIVNDLDAWLQARPLKPSIPDPSGSGVTFDHRWGQATYAYFRDRIHVHAAQMQDAYDEPDKDTSVRKWQEVFGEGFTAPAVKASSGRFGTAAAAAASTIGRSGRAG